MNVQDSMELPEKGLWKMASTPDHQLYYYHTKTKETKWELSQEEIDELTADLKVSTGALREFDHLTVCADT